MRTYAPASVFSSEHDRHPPLVSLPDSRWCVFSHIPSPAEAALVSKSCLFSLATLEVYQCPETQNFAMIEQVEPGAWRWAVLTKDGLLLEHGQQSAPESARQAAEEFLHLDAS